MKSNVFTLSTLSAALVLSLFAGAAQATVVFSEDFESATATHISDTTTDPNLWHVTDNFAHGGSNAMGFVKGETTGTSPDGNYAVVGVTGGPLTLDESTTSPAIIIPGTGTTTLSFWAFMGDEWDEEPNDYDRLSLFYNIVGGGSGILASSAPLPGGPAFTGVVIPEWGGTAAYNLITVDLTALAGQTVTLELRFETLDENFNGYPGARIDDVLITNTTQPVPEPATLALLGLGLAGLGLSRRRA